MKVKKPILLIQDNFGGLDQNQGQNPIVHCRFVGFPPLFGAKNASKSLKMPMFPYKMDTLYILQCHKEKAQEPYLVVASFQKSMVLMTYAF